MGQLKGPFGIYVTYDWAGIQTMRLSTTYMFEIIDAVPEELKEAADQFALVPLRGEIELKNVTFGYEAHKLILKDISFPSQGW